MNPSQAQPAPASPCPPDSPARSGSGLAVAQSSPNRLARRLLGFASSALLVALTLSSVAAAATKYEFVERFPPAFPENQSWTPSSFQSVRAQGVAVSTENGHIYVADSGRGVIFDFESRADKTPTSWNGENTPAGSFGGLLSVAVDNTTGDVYVADTTHAVVDKFDEDGDLVESFGDTTPVANGQLSGAKTPAGSFVPPTGFEGSFGIAVDQSTQNLYVVDPGHEVIDVFDAGGGYLGQITDTPEGLYTEGGARTSGIAVSAATGSVFVSDAGSGLVFKFDASGGYESTWNGSDLPNGFDSAMPGEGLRNNASLPLAVADARQQVLVGHGQFAGTVSTFDEEGDFLPPQLGNEGFHNISLRAVALDQSSEYLYSASASTGAIDVFEPLLVPDVEIDPAADVKPQSAVLAGHVVPAGGDIVECHFELIADGDFLGDGLSGSNSWEGAVQLPCETEPASSLPFSGPKEVGADAVGLEPGRVYHVRLVASSAQGTNVDVAQTFLTPGEYEYSTAFGEPGSGPGELSDPRDVAVDAATGDVYVADTGNHRIVKFDASGAFVTAWGSGPGGLQDPRYVEVDNSSGPSAHMVYVADTGTATVRKFSSTGSPIASWGEGGSISLSKGGVISGITVSPTGSLFVSRAQSPYLWTEIGQDGVFRLETPTVEGINLASSSLGGIEVDASGAWYQTLPFPESVGGVASDSRSSFGRRVFYPGGYRRLKNGGIALDRLAVDIFVSQEDHIDLLRPEPGCCSPPSPFGFGTLVDAQGLAFDPPTKLVFAADAGADRVAVFSRVPMPGATTGSASTAGTTAELTGSVEPDPSGPVTGCRFDYGTTLDYELGSVPCSPGTPILAGAEVTAGLTGLDPRTPYHYRLVAEGPSELPSYGDDRTFMLAGDPPATAREAAIDVSGSEATLTGQVNPNSAPTSFRFEYGPTTEYGRQTALPDPIAEDNSFHDVAARVRGLTPGTTYHFRLVAISFDGLTAGPDRTFDTPDVPSIFSAAVTATGTTTATATATVAAGFSPTTVRLEYGTSSAYGSSLLDGIGSGNEAHIVSFQLTGLAPGTVHHARVVATNAVGTSAGSDVVFTTRDAGRTTEPPKSCKRGFVRKRGKCRKRHKKKRPSKHRRKQGDKGSRR